MLSVKLIKETSKNVVDTTFRDLLNLIVFSFCRIYFRKRQCHRGEFTSIFAFQITLFSYFCGEPQKVYLKYFRSCANICIYIRQNIKIDMILLLKNTISNVKSNYKTTIIIQGTMRSQSSCIFG